jgi:oxygen-independent coproporphyrinogen III oxidase
LSEALIQIKNRNGPLPHSQQGGQRSQMPKPIPKPAHAPRLQRDGGCGPQYASYPTADRFVEAFSSDDHAQALQQRHSGLANTAMPLSVYVHIPFCESLCHFCSCNKIITRQHGRAAAYLRYLSLEVDLHTAELGPKQAVVQLHLGGGTPTFLADGELRALMAMLRRSFLLAPAGDCSIEVDPRTVDAGRLEALAQLGFNQISFGVQDFDGAVQKKVNRKYSPDQVNSLVEAARPSGFTVVNIDLMYGLPQQTLDSFGQTVALAAQMRPDQIALHCYDHMPERYYAHRRISAPDLPDAQTKAAMLSRSGEALVSAGYMHIGMAHFALPENVLAKARRQGRLHRAIQGYSAQPEYDRIGLGMSAMGHIGATYSQNAQTLEAYCALLDHGRFPVVRGIALTRDDLVRRAVINALICQGLVVFESIELAYMIDFSSYFAPEMAALRGLAAQGLVTLDGTAIGLTDQGWFFATTVAMAFDRYLQNDRRRTHQTDII